MHSLLRDTEVSLEESDYLKKLDSVVLKVEGGSETGKWLSGCYRFSIA